MIVSYATSLLKSFNVFHLYLTNVGQVVKFHDENFPTSWQTLDDKFQTPGTQNLINA